MEASEENTNTNNNKKLKIILIAISLLLIGSFIGNVVLYSKKIALISERDKALLYADSSLSVRLQVEKYLFEAQNALNRCKTTNDELNNTIASLNAEITEKQKVIAQLSIDRNSFEALKNQLQEAKKLFEDCEAQVNAIMKDKGDMDGRIKSLNETLANVKNENLDLKKKLEWAQHLKTYDVNIMSYRVTKDELKPTAKAKKVNRIAVSFTLAENKVVEAGNKNIYLVIYDPMRNVLSKTGEKFTNSETKTEQPYSSSMTVDFKNEEQKISMDYDADNKITKGKYLAEIYTDGKLSGKGEFDLR